MILRVIEIEVSPGTFQTADNDVEIDVLLDQVSERVDAMVSTLKSDGFDVHIME